ncbi:unnamed protein product [Cuscuta campestris]|uniref:Uncharacterized protein n=2 Tax=Cuscuta sect. Cleistogrammica TaxID=1824901 RepID=A0A484LM69_9ASTE|nr:hypothetical protein DM860_015447 [Cuscuta australis]VFQ77394.1 unnamed protein product [Cuscuta campestris]
MKMENSFPLKMKRKDLEQVYDEFSDFSLSAPARKIRRLDAELPPILEDQEDCQDVAIAYEPLSSGQSFTSYGGRGVEIEELPNEPYNKETAIVLFKPENHLFPSPQNLSVKIDPMFMYGLKNQAPWRSQFYPMALSEADEVLEASNSNECRAVVPWVPSQFSTREPDVSSQTDTTDMMMDAEEPEGVTMEVEDNGVALEGKGIDASGNEGLQQWQQQYCMIPPQPLQNASPPITWFQ